VRYEVICGRDYNKTGGRIHGEDAIEIFKEMTTKLTMKYGGCTVLDGVGMYQARAGNVMGERSTVVLVSIGNPTQEDIDFMNDWCVQLRDKMCQETVLMTTMTDSSQLI